MNKLKTDDFIREFGKDLIEELFESVYGSKFDNIKITEKHNHDVINSVGRAEIIINGEPLYVEWEDGNMNGSQIIDYSFEGLTAPKRYVTAYKFVPVVRTELALKIYEYWKKENWFKEKERSMNYDFHFAPGEKTQTYYKNFAAQKGLRIESESVLIQ
jgi:hypothetical protein